MSTRLGLGDAAARRWHLQSAREANSRERQIAATMRTVIRCVYCHGRIRDGRLGVAAHELTCPMRGPMELIWRRQRAKFEAQAQKPGGTRA